MTISSQVAREHNQLAWIRAPQRWPWIWTVLLTVSEGVIAYLTVIEADVPIGWAVVGFVLVATVTFLAIMPTRVRTSSRATTSEDPPLKGP